MKRPEINWLAARIVGLAVLLLLLCSEQTPPIDAQSASLTWSRPVNLSNSPEGSGYPAIVADGYGYVHVFWEEDMGGRAMRARDPLPSGNSIFYSRWDGESWIAPRDVLSVPDDAIAGHASVAIDADNTLHAVWTGQSNFYYSHAPSSQAYSAQAWSKPAIIASDSARSSHEISIAADATGNLHIAYATRGGDAGVYYTRLMHGKMDWETPIKASAALDALEDSFANVSIIADHAGRLHLVWQTNQREGYGQAIYYVRSQDGGKSWSLPVQLGYRGPDDFDVGWPYIVAREESELHLIYNAGTRPVGRYHRISQDGGETWSSPVQILTDMEGINGYVVPLVDGAGQMHLIINMRTRSTQVVGLYYARWSEKGWSPVVPMATEAPNAPTAHYTAAAVGLGNELHVAWTQLDGGEIWYVRGLLSGVTPRATQTPQPAGSAFTATPVPTLKPRSDPTTTPLPAGNWVSMPPLAAPSGIPNRTLLFGIAIPAMVVLTAFVWAWTRLGNR